MTVTCGALWGPVGSVTKMGTMCSAAPLVCEFRSWHHLHTLTIEVRRNVSMKGVNKCGVKLVISFYVRLCQSVSNDAVQKW